MKSTMRTGARVESWKLGSCGAAWYAARRLVTAAVRLNRGRKPIDNRQQVSNLPHIWSTLSCVTLHSDSNGFVDKSRWCPTFMLRAPTPDSDSTVGWRKRNNNNLSSRIHSCLSCHGRLHAVHRNGWQRFIYRSLYRCSKCGLAEPHRRGWCRIHIARIANCPRCGCRDLKVFRKRDRVEGFQSSVWRRVQSWLGAKLYYCHICRLQFYDLRPMQPRLHHNHSS